jgi:hypothetical protein
MDDLNWAINAAGDAMEATPEDHPNRVNWLNTLGNKLGTRFKATGSIDDLSRAIDAMNTAMKATPQDHPNRAIIFNSLGNHLGMRFKRTGTRMISIGLSKSQVSRQRLSLMAILIGLAC